MDGATKHQLEEANALPSLRVAVVQAAPVMFDVVGSLEKLASLAAEAAAAGAQLAVFPEVFISGYPRGLSFHSPLTVRQRLGVSQSGKEVEIKDDLVTYWKSSIEVPGPAVDFISDVARRNSLQLVVGVTERCGGTLYCSALFFGSDGAYLGSRRKLMPTTIERRYWGFGDGSTLGVYETPIGKMTALLCWENYMPLLRAAMYAKGVRIICAPTAADSDNWVATMRHIALEGRCFVLAANQFTRGRDYPPEAAELFEPDEVIAPGGSCIIDPMGRFLVEPRSSGEEVLIADLDPAEIVRGKADFDVVGHYSRPDVFQLSVDERQRRPVRKMERSGPDGAAESGLDAPSANAFPQTPRGSEESVPAPD